MSRFFVFLLLLLPNAAIGDEQIIWRIGKPDRDWSELAIAGKFQEYAARFGGKPIVFEVGRSEAEKDWPFIHPGPDDSGWAIRGYGSRTIGFDLPEAPRGVFRLRIEFVDTQSFNPPRYEITLGDQTVSFQLPRGGGDGSLADPRAGKPHKIELTLPVQMLKKGRNEIYLACTNGSWVQYDAVTLLADPEAILPPAEIESITLTPKPLFVRREGELRRVIDVSVSLTAPASDVRMMVEAGGRSIDVTRKQGPSFSLFSREVGLPDSSDPVEMKVTVAVGGRTKSVVETIPPQRKWLIFAAPSAHTDVGFTDIQPKCAELHNENTDAAIELMKRFPDFSWNLEVSWQAENYINSRQGERLADFFRFAKEGRLGVQALYGNMLTGLCSAEEACRLTAYAHKLFREHGVPFQSAMITDLPTQEATLPMILSESGIRYFSCGDNDGRFKQMPHNRPYWWEGPDGSRVLMMQMRGYGHAYRWGLDAGVETARWRITAALAEYDQRTDYPFDAVFLHGAFCDNLALNPKLAEVCRDWNERYAFPKIILCRNAEFFEYIEEKYGEQLPTYRGSGGTYWEDGAGSSARETALTRNAQAAVGNGEKFLALAERIGGKPYPADAIDKVWRDCMMYNEHTWGAHCSGSQPESDFTKAQWKIKAQFAVDADTGAEALLRQGVDALTSLIKTEQGGTFVVNTSSWERTDVIISNAPDTSDSGPWENAALTVVRNVPSCGYRRLTPSESSAAVVARPAEGEVIESRYYRVQFDRTTGGIKSIRDKELDKELIDPKAEFGANQYVHVAGGGNGTQGAAHSQSPGAKVSISTSGPASLRRFRFPKVGEMMIVETAGRMAQKIVSAVLVLEDVKRIDFDNRVAKILTYDKEGVYFAFPFAVEKPVFRYGCPAGIVNANREMLPGACLDWFTLRHFVEVEGQDAAIAWATPDSPMVCFQDVNKGIRRLKLDANSGHLFAYVMNNYWDSNYLAGQGGELRFRFAITSRAKSDPAASARFGWDAANPLQTTIAEPNPAAVLPDRPTSLLSIAEPNVMATGVKLSENGRALIVRLWETEGRATTAHLKLDRRIPAEKANACNLVEELRGELPIRDGRIAVPIRGRGLATVRIE